MNRIDRSPTRLASALSIVAAVLVLVVSGLYSWLTLVVGGVGLLGLAIGLATARQDAVSAGGAFLFGGVLAAGLDGAPALVLLAGAVAAVLAWDSATTAIELGDQLGRAAPTWRAELAHTTLTALVGLAGLGVAYGIYVSVAWSASLTGVFVLVFAVLVLSSVLR
jgi:hypothetical protein